MMGRDSAGDAVQKAILKWKRVGVREDALDIRQSELRRLSGHNLEHFRSDVYGVNDLRQLSKSKGRVSGASADVSNSSTDLIDSVSESF